MGNPTQRGFDATNDDRYFGISFTATLAVNQHTAVGSLAAHAARRVSIVAADFAVGGVAVDHGIHVARSHTIKQIGFAKCLKRLGAVPLWLGDDAHAKTLRLQHAANHRHAKTGVVHISVTRHQNDVATVPTQLSHLGAAHGQKRCCAKPRRPVLAVTGQRLGNPLKKRNIDGGVHEPLILCGIDIRKALGMKWPCCFEARFKNQMTVNVNCRNIQASIPARSQR